MMIIIINHIVIDYDDYHNNILCDYHMTKWQLQNSNI